MTGLRGDGLPEHARLIVNDCKLAYARVFSKVPRGGSFWYKNSLDLVEIAINHGSAVRELGLQIGNSITIENDVSVVGR
jgi:S-adenosylmethionine hydrolase